MCQSLFDVLVVCRCGIVQVDHCFVCVCACVCRRGLIHGGAYFRNFTVIVSFPSQGSQNKPP